VDYPGFTLSGLDGMHVLSSSDIPYQARGCNAPTLTFLLGVACRQKTRRELPPELNQMIVGYTNGIEFGITWEQAEERRRALMQDRKVQSEDVNEVIRNHKFHRKLNLTCVGSCGKWSTRSIRAGEGILTAPDDIPSVVRSQRGRS
jgi:hypothetical protein